MRSLHTTHNPLLTFVTLAIDKVACYYESWAASYFAPEDIDVSICTHVNYAFLGINEDGSFRLDGGDGKNNSSDIYTSLTSTQL